MHFPQLRTAAQKVLALSYPKASYRGPNCCRGYLPNERGSLTFDAAMKKTVLLLLGVALAPMSFGQTAARIVFNNAGADPYMVFNPAGTNTTYLVIDNPAVNAITETPAGAGNIKSEHENNRIRWQNFGTTAMTYVVPFTTASNVKIPLSVNKTTAGTGAVGNDSLSFVLATYNHLVFATAEWNNDLYKPTGVTHMNDNPTGSMNNSANAVNRFWIIDPRSANWGFTTPPAANLTFVNNDVQDIDVVGLPGSRDVLNPGTVLQAQRFNTGASKWGDYQSLLTGTPSTYFANTPSAGRSTVVGVAVTGANFYRAWTLSSTVTPLPIELTSWKGECVGHEVKLTWSTATESHNDFFTIEKSRDAQNWEAIAEVDAVGNSSSENQYSYTDARTEGLAYYRLSQTDENGDTEVFNVVAAGCDANNTEIVNAWDDGTNVNVLVSSTQEGVYDVYVTDAAGRNMLTQGSQVINKNFTQLAFNKQGMARGMYTITLQNNANVMSRRIVVM
jgi:hypothetical protein